MKSFYIGVALLAVIAVGAAVVMMRGHSWDKTFARNPDVDVSRGHFKNRYGIKLAGDLHVPKKRVSAKMPAIAVSGPFGAVKEQVSGRYAQEMASRGFIAMAFDASYTGRIAGRVAR